MPRDLLDRLQDFKSRFEPSQAGPVTRLLGSIARRRFSDAASLLRLHETLLFLRAYPINAEVARLADAILFTFDERIEHLRQMDVDLTPFEEPEVSGIAGTSFSAVFSYAAARHLITRHARNLDIDWDRYERTDKLGATLRCFLPLLEEDWPVEANVPYRDWIRAARGSRGTDLGWLIDRIAQLPMPSKDQAQLYDALDIPLAWKLGRARTTRSRFRRPVRRPFYHTAPLLRRSEVSLEQELAGPPLPIRTLPPVEARRALDQILDSSAMRYRELYGFTHSDANRVLRADAGRGVEILFWGIPPAQRLPLRAYHAGMFFKNGVPAGYIETLSLFERAEVGFNLYYTFREGESAWLYARLLRLLRQVLGVTCFSVDPYQIGFENHEAIDSGAFWFYRKLGFRPVNPEIALLVEHEEKRMRARPDHRSSKRTLEQLAEGYILYSATGAAKEWNRFRIRSLALAVQRSTAQHFGGDPARMRRSATQAVARATGVETESDLTLVLSLIPDLERWPEDDRIALREILAAKAGPDEASYLLRMQEHRRLRTALLRLGSS